MGFGQSSSGLSPSSIDNVAYHGGPVIRSPTAYAIFWLPPGRHFEWNATTSADASYQAVVTGFLSRLGGKYSSSLWRLVTQYSDTTGPVNLDGMTFGGSVLDPTVYPHEPLQDSDLQDAVVRSMSRQGWSAGLSSVFFVYTAYGTRTCLPDGSCALDQWCGYHSFFSNAGATTIYSSTPSVMVGAGGPCTFPDASPNADLWADNAVYITSHELFEAVTDPTTDAWTDTNGAEIGDKCVRSPGPMFDRDGADVLLGPAPVGSFIVQGEWSNRSAGCALQLPPTVTSVSPSWGSTAGGATVQVDGTGLRSVPGVSRLTFVPTGSDGRTAPGSNVSCVSQTSDADVCTVTTPSDAGAVDLLATVQQLSSSPNAGDQFTYRAPCTSISVGALSNSPQPAGTSIRLVMTAGAPSNCFLQRYQFFVTPPGGTKALLQDTNIGLADWGTVGLAPGVYQIILLGFPDSHDTTTYASGSMSFTLTAAAAGVPGTGGGGGGGGAGGGRTCSPCRLE
jgi:hypothetical protein